MFEVNVLALMTCTREAVKRMGTKEGCVVNISSMSGHRLTSTPTNVYCATKFAVKALTEATRRELRAKVCAVLCVCVAAYPHLCVFVAVVVCHVQPCARVQASPLRPLHPTQFLCSTCVGVAHSSGRN